MKICIISFIVIILLLVTCRIRIGESCWLKSREPTKIQPKPRPCVTTTLTPVTSTPKLPTWSSWEAWGDCVGNKLGWCAANGTQLRYGQQTRRRQCDAGGNNCDGTASQQRDCTRRVACDAPRDGAWSKWSVYGACSVTCGNAGVRRRTRACDNPPPLYGGAECMGAAIEVTHCEAPRCPNAVDGAWGQWDTWNSCSQTCNEGTRIRMRKCNDPEPKNGGLKCPDADTKFVEMGKCFIKYCPIDGGWSAWFSCADFMQCFREDNTPCALGYRHICRDCNNPVPAHGGRHCDGNEERQKISCWYRRPACPTGVIPPQSAAFFSVSPTTFNVSWIRAPYGSEVRLFHLFIKDLKTQTLHEKVISTAQVAHPELPKSFRKIWTFSEGDLQVGNNMRFWIISDGPSGVSEAGLNRTFVVGQIDGSWSPWGTYGPCTPRCNVGQKTRSRQCTSPAPSNNGRQCDGSKTSTIQCYDC